MMVCSLRSNFTTTTKNSIVSLAIIFMYVDNNETTLMGFYLDVKWHNCVHTYLYILIPWLNSLTIAY